MVYIVDIPKADDRGKQGPDDFLASGGTVEGLLEYARKYSDFDSRDRVKDWPVLCDEALYGLVGEIVGTIAPDTEADPVAIAMEFITRFANIIGRGAHFEVEGDRHFLKINYISVGRPPKEGREPHRGA